jgi:hypothetical protein
MQEIAPFYTIISKHFWGACPNPLPPLTWFRSDYATQSSRKEGVFDGELVTWITLLGYEIQPKMAKFLCFFQK